jgi:broad specificity phosphatase PhoE
MRVVVVRHYKTLLNASDRILGWGDSPAIDGWLADVAFVEKRLRDRGVEFDAIYSSGLERARQTALYYARDRRTPALYDSPDLNEVNYGDFYGKSKKWVAKNVPQHKKDPDFVYPGGESFREMQRRSVRFLTALAGVHARHCVLLVVHAGVIRGLVCHFLNLDYARNLKRKISHRYIGEFTFDGTRCIRYDEWGKPSGFVRDGIVNIPCVVSDTSDVVGPRMSSIDTRAAMFSVEHPEPGSRPPEPTRR